MGEVAAPTAPPMSTERFRGYRWKHSTTGAPACGADGARTRRRETMALDVRPVLKSRADSAVRVYSKLRSYQQYQL